MFVLSLKASKRRLIPTLLCVALLAAMLIATVCFPATRTMVTSTTAATGDSDEACATFLKTLGYTVELPAVSVREVLLPDDFDDTLAAYNALQQEAGFDLSLYAGQRVKYRTYDLAEHITGTAAQAHLYVYDGVIIGGDIAAVNGDFTDPLCQTAHATC